MLHIHVLAYICIYPTERKPARLTRTSSNSSIGTQHEKIKSTNANKYLLRRHGKRRNANQPNSRQAPATKNIDDVICAQRSKGKRRNANQPNSRRETKKQKTANATRKNQKQKRKQIFMCTTKKRKTTERKPAQLTISASNLSGKEIRLAGSARAARRLGMLPTLWEP